ncbi:hypothetical protein ACFO3O_19415 [Dokdonia ponticola]|uniref:Uncharacterized protein n=1 Tax=Dokdonia ponticola TaxID=2041041 RepID=A0ABV9I1U0_9FLAO
MIVAYWDAPFGEEEILTKLFKNRIVHNHWCRFSFDDLIIIKRRINTYSIFENSVQKYKQAM